MDTVRALSVLIMLVCLASGIYYMAVDDEVQGTVVVLLGILYFVGVREVTRS